MKQQQMTPCFAAQYYTSVGLVQHESRRTLTELSLTLTRALATRRP